MSTYIESFDLVNDSTFGKRLQMAMWIGAAAILANAQSSAGAKTFARNQLKGPADTDLAPVGDQVRRVRDRENFDGR
ncbi:MAG: hypothetical protein IPK42_25140 [Betaproteobacteria bacterium]|nr:hypothetical protein [Betaproteobacteria bacterium]